MRRVVLVLGLIVIAVTQTIPAAHAASDEKPIQIALWNPVQIFPAATSVKGVRLNLLYGLNKDVRGLDVGVINRTTGVFKGLQYGFVGIVGGEMHGWQAHWINTTAVKMYGLQSGIFNQTIGAEGVQFGWVNVAESMHGLQVGLYNQTQTMDGMQIGILNVISKAKSHPILPIVNWTFE